MRSVLWLARTLPLPASSGDRIYTGELAAALARTGLAVTFVGLETGSPDALRTLSPDMTWCPVPGSPARQAGFLVRNLPMVAVRHATAAYGAMLADLLRERAWDAVILDQYAMVWCTETLRQVHYEGVVVHIAHDFETDVNRDIARAYKGNPLRKLALTLNARRTAVAEQTLVQRADMLVTLTDRDRRLLSAYGEGKAMLVIPPGYRGRRLTERRITEATPRRVVSVGSFEWLAKQINLRRFLATIDGIFTEHKIEMRVIGHVPEDFRLSLPDYRSVKFMGFVDDITGEFAQSRIGLVFDETGGGFKLKMLDYIFNRVPLFGLVEALEGLPPEVARCTAGAATMAGLADSIVQSIDRIDVLNGMQDGAAAAAADRFQWEAGGRSLAEAIDTLAEKRGASSPARPSKV